MILDRNVERNDLDDLLDLEVADVPEAVDERAVHRYRMSRLREQMWEFDISACLLFDPVNIRYASGARRVKATGARNSGRYLLVVSGGPAILFEHPGRMHLAHALEMVDEVRPAATGIASVGSSTGERERNWARETAALLREQIATETRIGVDRVNAGATFALAAEGFTLVDAQEALDVARSIKSEEEVECIRASLRATEAAVAELRNAIRPGLSENELWSILHRSGIAQDGDHMDARLLSSGPRTNPWFQEASARIVQPNELIALDTNVIGCHGYYADFSRTFHAGPDRPSEEQRTLYWLAHEQIHANMAILRPEMTFREFSERAWRIPEPYVANRHYLAAHGCGLAGEYPHLYHGIDFPQSGYDGVLLPGMTISVESYIGAEGGREGVKLEQQCLITDTGVEVLSRFPFEHELLAG